jgi:hypothetical protein
LFIDFISADPAASVEVSCCRAEHARWLVPLQGTHWSCHYTLDCRGFAFAGEPAPIRIVPTNFSLNDSSNPCVVCMTAAPTRPRLWDGRGPYPNHSSPHTRHRAATRTGHAGRIITAGLSAVSVGQCESVKPTRAMLKSRTRIALYRSKASYSLSRWP